MNLRDDVIISISAGRMSSDGDHHLAQGTEMTVGESSVIPPPRGNKWECLDRLTTPLCLGTWHWISPAFEIFHSCFPVAGILRNLPV
ncbi:hypothetical protein CEXT_675821 [Caerostris extrusa]|uniref:Uncharacterized protein n=1 Tax=Caerostris extrusa TaxID=172846 RepID=A0AAV4XC29_CAEEX|nr:hypothetical protein CEXT_675821 [Caerostris extrusa]